MPDEMVAVVAVGLDFGISSKAAYRAFEAQIHEDTVSKSAGGAEARRGGPTLPLHLWCDDLGV